MVADFNNPLSIIDRIYREKQQNIHSFQVLTEYLPRQTILWATKPVNKFIRIQVFSDNEMKLEINSRSLS